MSQIALISSIIHISEMERTSVGKPNISRQELMERLPRRALRYKKNLKKRDTDPEC